MLTDECDSGIFFSVASHQDSFPRHGTAQYTLHIGASSSSLDLLSHPGNALPLTPRLASNVRSPPDGPSAGFAAEGTRSTQVKIWSHAAASQNFDTILAEALLVVAPFYQHRSNSVVVDREQRVPPAQLLFPCGQSQQAREELGLVNDLALPLFRHPLLGHARGHNTKCLFFLCFNIDKHRAYSHFCVGTAFDRIHSPFFLRFFTQASNLHVSPLWWPTHGWAATRCGRRRNTTYGKHTRKGEGYRKSASRAAVWVGEIRHKKLTKYGLVEERREKEVRQDGDRR